MQARLIIKKFGPLRDIDVELRNVNVLIGAQASGKSALAKLYTICKSPLAFINKPANPLAIMEPGNKNGAEKNFKTTLEEYNILTFLEANTFIEFDSPVHYFKYDNEKITYKRKLLDEIAELENHWTIEQEDKERMGEMLWGFQKKLFHFTISLPINPEENPDIPKQEKFIQAFTNKNFSEEEIKNIVEKIKNIEEHLQSNTALYIPAERNFIPILKGASSISTLSTPPSFKYFKPFPTKDKSISVIEKAAFS